MIKKINHTQKQVPHPHQCTNENASIDINE